MRLAQTEVHSNMTGGGYNKKVFIKKKKYNLDLSSRIILYSALSTTTAERTQGRLNLTRFAKYTSKSSVAPEGDDKWGRNKIVTERGSRGAR